MAIWVAKGRPVIDNPRLILTQLQAIDFTGKGEAFVKSCFLTPLLSCLGYEAHKDYEVIRHGDDGSAYKLRYPPVEKGALRIKHYNPDYVPTIRKKMFWIIEAKSPKDVRYPFEAKYLVQGLQYCIHPEIQAKYLLMTNGMDTAVYDAHGSVFFDKDIYEPILAFKSTELVQRWDEIFYLLSVETLRIRIEADLKKMYDKLCLSSLDKSYPHRLIQQIGASAAENAQQIERHVIHLYVEGMDRDREIWRRDMDQIEDLELLFSLMDLPLRGGRVEANYFVEKSLAAGVFAHDVFEKLTENFDTQRIFRKLQSWVGLCHLNLLVEDPVVKDLCRAFFDRYKDAELPLLNQVECALLRLTRKVAVISFYAPAREHLRKELASAPELIRLVRPPTALDVIYPFEILQNRQAFERIRRLSDSQLQGQLANLLNVEGVLEDDFRNAHNALPNSEKEFSGFETYGMGGKHYGFKNILIHYDLEPRPRSDR